MTHSSSPFEPGRNCWRIARAERASVIVDAADYFRVARQAMLSAKRQIFLIGWDFDGRIPLEGNDAGPDEVGAFITWLVDRTPELEVYLLRWDIGALKTLTRGTTVATLAKWVMHSRIHSRLDGHHPTGASHHQKIVVIDDCLAFCGGIDMTVGRWDTREHRDDDPRRVDPSGALTKPWHDATTALQGPVAAALGELSRARWARAGGGDIAAPSGIEGCWPDGLPVDFTDIDVAIARTVPKMDDQEPSHEIEALYLDLIARAKHRIYAESQYFASRKVAEAIARRLEEPDGPEIVIVNPETADGWLEPLAMDTARARLVEALRRRDVHRRFRLYHPYTEGRQPIYVHAKVLVIDDEILRVGSSNFNNRSLGLDSECDVAIHAEAPETATCIAAIRNGLIAEHLGVAPEDVARMLEETGSLIATVETLRGPNRTLRDYLVPDLSSVETWLADNEVLDPEEPHDVFEATDGGGLLRRLGDRIGRHAARRGDGDDARR